MLVKKLMCELCTYYTHLFNESLKLRILFRDSDGNVKNEVQAPVCAISGLDDNKVSVLVEGSELEHLRLSNENELLKALLLGNCQVTYNESKKTFELHQGSWFLGEGETIDKLFNNFHRTKVKT